MNKNLIKRLDQDGFKYQIIQYVHHDSVNPAIMIDTNYEGAYPTHTVLNQLHQVETIVRRYKGLQCEPRGYHTAILIYQKGVTI